MFLLPILKPHLSSSTSAFLNMYSAYWLKRGYSFFLLFWQTRASLFHPHCGFLASVQFCIRIMRYSGILTFLCRFHSLTSVTQWPFCNQWGAYWHLLILFCFPNYPMCISSNISCSSAFSKANLNNWHLLFHVGILSALDKPKYYFTKIASRVCTFF